MILTVLAVQALGRCCCAPAAASASAGCHGGPHASMPQGCHCGHEGSAPASHDTGGCTCELRAVAMDLERCAELMAPQPHEIAFAVPVPAVLSLASAAPAEIPDEFRDLPPPDPEGAPPSLRAPPPSAL